MPGGADVVPVVVYRLIADTVGYRRTLLDASSLILATKNIWINSIREMGAASRAAGFGVGPGLLGGLAFGGGVAAVAVGAFAGVTAIKATSVAIHEIADLSWSLVKSATQLGMEYEKSSVSFNVLTGSMEMGKRTLDDIYQLSITNSFTFRQMSQAAQMLLGLGVPADNDNMVTVLSRLSDLATGDERKLQRLALAYGQVMAAGRLRGEELRQFTNVGVGVGDFAKAYGKPTAEFRADLEAGLVPASVVTKTLNQLTNVGGRFADLSAQVNRTVAGQWNQLTERVELFLARLGKGFFDKFAVADKIGSITQNLVGLENQVDGLLDRLDRTGIVQEVWRDIQSLWKASSDAIHDLNESTISVLETYRNFRDLGIDVFEVLSLGIVNVIELTRNLIQLVAFANTGWVSFLGTTTAFAKEAGWKDMENWARAHGLEARGDTEKLNEIARKIDVTAGITRSGVETYFTRLRANISGATGDLSKHADSVRQLGEFWQMNKGLSEGTQSFDPLLFQPIHPGGRAGQLEQQIAAWRTMREHLDLTPTGAGLGGAAAAFAGEFTRDTRGWRDSIERNARTALGGAAAAFAVDLDYALDGALKKDRKLAPVKFELSSDALKAAIDLNKHIADQGFGPIDRFQIMMSRFREARFGPGNDVVPNFNLGLGAMGGVGAIGANLTLQAMSDKNFRFGAYEEFEKLRKSIAHLEDKGIPAMTIGSVEGQDAINRTLDQTQGIHMEILRVLTIANSQRQALTEEIRQYNAALGYDTGGY